ncbi:MAG: isoleucine--tRNA ligase [Bacteroidales bacterium]|jgi:isoleucyl-tRNA synthetase|nr:isoleucine--tRNA ligase [Bacteroidales bacterium]
MKKYPEYKNLSLTDIADNVLDFWKDNNVFEQSLKKNEGKESFVFYEGPPSANGQPGIHHVMSRAIKDIFCRYKTLKGYYVKRKAGWDTHGLPVEISVEKSLGITKEDIGKKISIADYNKECRKEVMKYKDMWDDLTVKMGYWVDLDDPYITFKSKYIETLWYLLAKIYEKGYLYKGYTIQPYSPAAGTGLSSHELNQPGCYRDVKDTTATVQFQAIRNEKSEFLFGKTGLPIAFMAWTTTPWTLPSNTALAVGANITYYQVETLNPYTLEKVCLILGKDLLPKYFNSNGEGLELDSYDPEKKIIPYKVIDSFTGKELEGVRYEQLIPWIRPNGDAFRVILGDYVSTEDGTGIVHIAPTFGADDARVGQSAGIVPLLLMDKDGNKRPMVDTSGRFYRIEDLDDNFVKDFVNVDLYKSFAGRYVKNSYSENLTDNDPTVDVDICVMLKQQNKAFKIEKHIHNYPHCWRTDKPVLYYPLDSWFIKSTAVKDRLIELNDTINWKPKATGTGRFGNWLENLQDWNLSRSRYWGTPLPIWSTEDGKERICISSVEHLCNEINKSIATGFMQENPYKDFVPGDYSDENYDKIDLHRPYVDEIILVSPSGNPMKRESDLIDVWFDSGAMPFAQYHYPFEKAPLGTDIEPLKGSYPADFIAEGVDQTRGWFYTLHAISTMCFDSVSFKTCISNGLVLDKNGNKMSKRLGNGVDPFETIAKYGPDATRWYMITNAQPWDNLKFDIDGIAEVQRKFFGTLYNTYSFFSLYANLDNFTYKEKDIDFNSRPEIDRWILSELNSLIKFVDECYADYEPTKVGREIQTFVCDYLSNWYVRLCRRRFWKGEYNEDKISAYQTLYTCLSTVAKLISPIAPFFGERLYCDLNNISGAENYISVHLTDFPVANNSYIDSKLEERMQMAQNISSMALSLRKRTNIRVRQPLSKIMLPVISEDFIEQIDKVKDLILSEINIKEIIYLKDDENILTKKVKPDFKVLGPKYGKNMKSIADNINLLSQNEINKLEKGENIDFVIDGNNIELNKEDVIILTEDIPGWVVLSEGILIVALDINITEDLLLEGYAREFVNRIQNLRKENDFNVTDRIQIIVENSDTFELVNNKYNSYICSETLTDSLTFVKSIENHDKIELDLTNGLIISILIKRSQEA